MSEFENLQEERHSIEKQMVVTAKDYLFRDISRQEAMQKSLELVLSYNYVIQKLREIGGWY